VLLLLLVGLGLLLVVLLLGLRLLLLLRLGGLLLFRRLGIFFLFLLPWVSRGSKSQRQKRYCCTNRFHWSHPVIVLVLLGRI
jgi:uncharacterized SAM-binding protein YcdF (DUF218 family)